MIAALNVGQTLTPILKFNAASLLEPFGKITVLKGTKEKPAGLNSRDTNGEIRAYARLAVNLDVSSVGANDRFD